MFWAQSRVEKDSVRILLSQQYWITVSSVGALIAHETMRRKKSLEWVWWDSQEWEQSIALIDTEELQSNPTQTVQKSTQVRVYTITSLSEITEEMREGIFEEFTAVIQDNISDTRYDFYTDIEAISDYNNIDPNILEQFLRNRYNWLSSRLDELKKWRVIWEEEKMSIRLYVESWVDDKDKKTRRKEMAKKYGVSIYVIWAITAWKLAENWEKMLNKSGSSIEWVPNDAPKWWVAIWETTLPLMQVDSQDAIDWEDDSLESVFSGEDVDFIRELASEFNLNDDSQRTVFLQDIFDLFPDSTIDDIKKILRDFPDDITHTNTKRSGEGMWALVNYNNEIKNKWRQKLKEFIDANTDTEKRKDMKVLCLPWIECLEIPLYLELWFRPENIIGVEAWIVKWKKDPEIIALFQANASRYWIQTRIWKLEKVLETEDTVFDVVSLDFLGWWSIHSKNLLRNISLSDSPIILTNFLWRRDAHLSQSWFDYEKKRNPEIILEGVRRYVLNWWNYQSMEREMIDYLSTNNQLSVLRETWLTSLVAGSLAVGLNQETLFYKKIQNLFDLYQGFSQRSSKIELNILVSLSRDFAPLIYAAMKNSYWNQSPKEVDTIYKIFRILFEFLTQIRDIREVYAWKYKTNKWTPMFFDFFLLKKVDEDYSFMLPFIRFATIAIQVLCDKKNANEYTMEIQRAHKGGFTQSDVIVVRKWSSIIGNIKLSELFNVYRAYLKKYKEWTLIPPNITRIELE